jgi:hypothetical protein
MADAVRKSRDHSKAPLLSQHFPGMTGETTKDQDGNEKEITGN